MMSPTAQTHSHAVYVFNTHTLTNLIFMKSICVNRLETKGPHVGDVGYFSGSVERLHVFLLWFPPISHQHLAGVKRFHDRCLFFIFILSFYLLYCIINNII